MFYDKDGSPLTKYERGEKLNDQKANTIADMAAVLGGRGKGNKIWMPVTENPEELANLEADNEKNIKKDERVVAQREASEDPLALTVRCLTRFNGLNASRERVHRRRKHSPSWRFGIEIRGLSTRGTSRRALDRSD